jgi:hypothetical protein
MISMITILVSKQCCVSMAAAAGLSMTVIIYVAASSGTLLRAVSRSKALPATPCCSLLAVQGGSRQSCLVNIPSTRLVCGVLCGSANPQQRCEAVSPSNTAEGLRQV